MLQANRDSVADDPREFYIHPTKLVDDLGGWAVRTDSYFGIYGTLSKLRLGGVFDLYPVTPRVLLVSPNRVQDHRFQR
jgi:hypothetical protein